MKLKKTISTLLLVFVAVACGIIVIKGFSNTRSDENASGQAQPLSSSTVATIPTFLAVSSDADLDVVYYFMTTQRCQNCMNIEAYTKEAVEKNFSNLLDRDKMVWKMVNLDEPQYNHFIKDYELITKSVVLVRYRDGKQVTWKNLDMVWNLLDDKVAFQEYITKEINTFVEAS